MPLSTRILAAAIAIAIAILAIAGAIWIALVAAILIPILFLVGLAVRLFGGKGGTAWTVSSDVRRRRGAAWADPRNPDGPGGRAPPVIEGSYETIGERRPGDPPPAPSDGDGPPGERPDAAGPGRPR